MRLICPLMLYVGFTSQSVHAGEKLELWPYIEKAAIQDQQDRRIEGISYLVGGTVAIVLPFVVTSSDSPLRDIGTYTLVPAGIYSVLYGGFTVLTDSPWMTLKKRVEALSGPAAEEDLVQWRLRREGHSRQALMERADQIRFWRYFWGGLEGGAGIAMISVSQSPPSIVTAGLLLGLSAYHLLFRKEGERIVDQLDRLDQLGHQDRTTVELLPEGGVYLAHRIYF